MAPGCTEVATTHMIIVAAPDEYQLPVCNLHHLEYSQPGHLKELRVLAGFAEQPQVLQPDELAEPGPEIIRP
jgi:hypothetical protein